MGEEDVLARAEAFALHHAVTPEQRRLLATAFHGRRTQLCQREVSPDDLDCVDLPRSVYAAVRGDRAAALPLAIATTVLWTGIDLLDDVMDGDLPPEWQGVRPAEITLAAATLISALAPLALSQLDAPAATLLAMHQTLAGGLLAMSGGQQADVAMADSDAATVEAVEASVAGKSGAGMAMLATLAAQFAGAPAETVSVYGEMGHALGTARQLHSDCYDLFVAPHSKDLAGGTRTWPIAWRLQGLAGEERGRFLALLHRARTDAAAREAVRAHLIEAGALRGCAFVIELYCDRARRALSRTHPREPAACALRRRIADTSLSASASHHRTEETTTCRHGEW